MAVATSSAVHLRTTLAGIIHGWRNEAMRSSIFIVTALILAFFILYPLGILFKWSLVNENTGAWTLNNYREFFSDPELYSALLTTLKLSVATSIGSLLIALPMAWGVSRTDMPLRGLVRSLVVLTFATPSFLIAVGWITLLGPRAGRINLFLQWLFALESTPFNIFSFGGLVFALTMFVYPFLFFSVVSALDNMDPSYEQSARILGASTLRVSLTVTLPIVTPAILSGLILVVIESFVVFGVPAFLGSPVQIDTLSTLVYGLFSDDPPRFDMAATAATPIVIVTALLLAFQAFYLGKRQFVTISGKSPQPQLVDVGKWKYALSTYTIGVVFVGIALPMLALLESSVLYAQALPPVLSNLTIEHYVALFTGTSIFFRALGNSFVLAIATVALCIFFTFVMAWIVERTNVPGREMLAFLSTMSLSFPGVALGMALVLAFSAGPFPLYGTLWLFIIGYFIKGTPIAFMFARSSLKQLSVELEQCSQVLGASWLKTMRSITIPLMKSGLLSVATLIFCLKFRDLATSIMLYTAGNETIAVLIVEFIEDGHTGPLGALALLVLFINLTLVMTSKKLVGKGAFQM